MPDRPAITQIKLFFLLLKFLWKMATTASQTGVFSCYWNKKLYLREDHPPEGSNKCFAAASCTSTWYRVAIKLCNLAVNSG
jgi:hypothetical protein